MHGPVVAGGRLMNFGCFTSAIDSYILTSQ